MGEFIQFLDLHSGSLTVLVTAMSMVITLVYVVATIFICKANIRSAKATREQVAEARRQYEEEHRPYISYQFIFERRSFYGMRFTNYGRRVANHVQIKLDNDFINSIPKKSFYNGLATLHTKEFALGIGQSYDIYFGASEFRDNPNKKPIRGTVLYCDPETGANYQEAFEIDFEKYGTIFSVNTPADDLHEDLKRQEAILKKLVKAVENLKEEAIDTVEETPT